MNYTLKELLQTSRLPRSEARVLLQYATGKSHAEIIAHDEQVLTGQELGLFERYVKQRHQGVPIAYILGYKEFFGREFIVTDDVLIPRPETELLVEMVLTHFKSFTELRVLDLGTGSGVLAITLALFSSKWVVFAVDQSEAALDVARKNAIKLNAKVDFYCGNWFSGLPAGIEFSFDLIISNPPYICNNDPHLLQGDLRFEPVDALTDHNDGYTCFDHILQGAPRYLNSKGWLMFEHGFQQGGEIRNRMRQHRFLHVETIQDLAGLERVTIGQTTVLV